jgi:hypothetical protein
MTIVDRNDEPVPGTGFRVTMLPTGPDSTKHPNAKTTTKVCDAYQEALLCAGSLVAKASGA